ncbi:hypothetical protein G6F43_004572 [Rhizopus delemar]|nr:hypothetical protein G6F43_004572 [Rhizopus delemar]
MSKRWKFGLATICLILILVQVCFMMKPLNQNILENKPWNNVKTIKPSTNRRKQSILYGQDEFSSQLPKLQHTFSPEPVEYAKLREKRRLAIKRSFLHGWNGYKTYALGHDELKPLTNKTHDPFGGWGATMVDALSTLLVMNLEDELKSVIDHVQRIDFNVDEDVSVFESIIRYLGGFISAYDLSDQKYPILLTQAQRLANVLLPAFDTPSGLPTHLWNPARNMSFYQDTLIAEAGTVQLELMMLSQFTQNPIYMQKAQAITDLLDNMDYGHGMYIRGLYPTSLDVEKGRFRDDTTTFGAMGDSAFEYLLTDGKIPQYGRMYLDSIRSMKQHMLRQIPGYDMLLLPPYDTFRQKAENSMDHLTCFVPGMLAMGSKTFNEPEDMDIAKGLLETCVFMYRTTKTGLSPENWYISEIERYNPITYNKTRAELERARDWWYDDGEIPTVQKTKNKPTTEYDINYKLPPVRSRPPSLFFGDERYILRPETVESLFILYRITGDQKYQEYGWEIFQAIDKWCKTKSAFAAFQNVDSDIETPEDNQIDSMESFLYAETFKYLYLLFSSPNMISLDKFVFNTEAHPFVRRHWHWA